MKNYYQILGLQFGASLAEIKSAYRKLAFVYHPDKNAENKLAEEKFIEITEAYIILSNKDKSYFYHVEYTDFLNEKQKPKSEIVQNYYKDPKQYPQQPIANASKRDIDKKGVIAGFAIIVVILFMAFILGYKKAEQIVINENNHFETVEGKKKFMLTKDEYYLIVSQDFAQTHDSTLMKIENVDSVIHILDSLINLH